MTAVRYTSVPSASLLTMPVRIALDLPKPLAKGKEREKAGVRRARVPAKAGTRSTDPQLTGAGDFALVPAPVRQAPRAT